MEAPDESRPPGQTSDPSPRLAVVDFGMGNVGSILNMLSRLGVGARRATEPHDIEGVDRIILPGVGAFDPAAERLRSTGFDVALKDAVEQRRVPILGLCLGMQLLLEGSEEGSARGFGWIPGRCQRFAFSDEHPRLPVPHMGWNTVRPGPAGIQWLQQDGARYYFVHSYYAVCEQEADVAGLTRYGFEFASVVARDNVIGVQFHPEKSHRFGRHLLSEFTRA